MESISACQNNYPFKSLVFKIGLDNKYRIIYVVIVEILFLG